MKINNNSKHIYFLEKLKKINGNYPTKEVIEQAIPGMENKGAFDIMLLDGLEIERAFCGSSEERNNRILKDFGEIKRILNNELPVARNEYLIVKKIKNILNDIENELF
jgi:hypothetical protein